MLRAQSWNPEENPCVPPHTRCSRGNRHRYRSVPGHGPVCMWWWRRRRFRRPDHRRGIIVAAGTEPQNPLLPTNTNEVGGGLIMNLLFQGLISHDAHGKSINQVAASITTTDSQTFTIKVKAGWTFTNGEAVTARSSSMPGTSVRSLPTTRSTPTSSGPSTATPRFTCQGLTPSPLPGPWSASRWSTP
jgi:hypothetical protein